MPFKVSYTTCLVLLVIFILCPGICLGKDTVNNKGVHPAVPPLMDSIRFKKDIQYCGVKIPLDRQEVKERLEKEMLLALWNRPQVILWMKRAGRYFGHMEKILKEQGLPADLKYVPLIESALRPHAASSRGAVGFWQFLRSTGKRYDLRIDAQVDERRNIFKSTRAACAYIKDLEKQFGSVLLALAAYNMGEHGLEGEIDIQKNKDYFSLYLPLETQRYLFKIICAKLILEHPVVYGFHLTPEDIYPRFTFDRVNFKAEADFPVMIIARAADVSFKTIKDYNPEIRGYYIGKGGMDLLLPKGRGRAFKERFRATYKKWKKTYQTRFHIVKKGESLTGIAETYKMSLSLLLKLNNLSVKGLIHPGDRLVIE